ncbi:uncharacterized protein LOC116986611 [Amblyraja radiata]|uniref:uncharacterized protein LOC116986611 n=1 Tax=Amblyraja radiata TaxID=386614 RepID=UPI001402C806|nr:uncharacterized protein LOC116986611 [Amblyraja radiata]
MGNIWNTLADEDTKSSVCEVIGIESDPEDLISFCAQPGWRTHHRKYLIPLIAEVKKLLRPSYEQFTATGNVAQISSPTTRGSRGSMPLKQWVISTKNPRIKLPSVVTNRNNDLLQPSTLNLYKHLKVLHGCFTREKLCTTARRLKERLMNNHRSNITANISATATKYPEAAIFIHANDGPTKASARNEDVSHSAPRPSTRNSSVSPTRCHRTPTIENADGSWITLARNPKLNINRKVSATIDRNPWGIISRNPVLTSTQKARTTNQNPSMVASEKPRTTAGRNLLLIATKNPNIFLIKNSANRNPNNIIRNTCTVTTQNPNVTTVQKLNRRCSGSIAWASRPPSKMAAAQYPPRNTARKRGGVLLQHSNWISMKTHSGSIVRGPGGEVNNITSANTNKIIIQRTKVHVIRKRGRMAIQKSAITTIRNVNIINTCLTLG